MGISKIPQTRTFTKKIFGGTLTISIERNTQSKPLFLLITDTKNIQANTFGEFLQKLFKSCFLRS